MQGVKHRAADPGESRILVNVPMPDEMGLEKKSRLRLCEHRKRHEFGQSPGAAPGKRHDEVLPHGDEEGADPVGRPEDGFLPDFRQKSHFRCLKGSEVQDFRAFLL